MSSHCKSNRTAAWTPFLDPFWMPPFKFLSLPRQQEVRLYYTSTTPRMVFHGIPFQFFARGPHLGELCLNSKVWLCSSLKIGFTIRLSPPHFGNSVLIFTLFPFPHEYIFNSSLLFSFRTFPFSRSCRELYKCIPFSSEIIPKSRRL